MSTAHDIELRAALERVTAERDDWRAKYEWMVAAAADEKLDGYRALGARVAKAEEERDAALAELAKAQAAAAADHAVAEAALRWFEHRQKSHDHECDGADCTLFGDIEAIEARHGTRDNGDG